MLDLVGCVTSRKGGHSHEISSFLPRAKRVNRWGAKQFPSLAMWLARRQCASLLFLAAIVVLLACATMSEVRKEICGRGVVNWFLLCDECFRASAESDVRLHCLVVLNGPFTLSLQALDHPGNKPLLMRIVYWYVAQGGFGWRRSH